ncbi:hypothetical protein [Oceanidesulfovibrio marinus]|uniref:hypothetical protein n=1 Tax=Oceanidesulfovibrio marinus TaxID=370038 RepID=UPI0011860309|nr:hypothetical protein [Oceanidesulfovibrio marinus]
MAPISIRLLACLVLCGVLMLWMVLNAHAQGAGSGNQSDDKPIAACPLTTPAYTAALAAEELDAVAGHKVRAHMTLDPATPPMGFYVTTLVDVLDAPEGAGLDVLPGFPDIALTPSAPGEYRVEVRINLIAKSSCGGVKAAQIGSGTLTLHVGEAE